MCTDRHNYIATNFCYMAFNNRLTALRGAVPLQGSKTAVHGWPATSPYPAFFASAKPIFKGLC